MAPIRGVRRLVLPICALAVIVLPFLVFGDQMEAWTADAMAGQGAVMLAVVSAALLAADVLLPVPSSLISLGAGAALGFWGGMATIWVGMTLGCAVGWAVGRGLMSSIDRSFDPDVAGRAPPGIWSLILCRPLPVLAEMTVLVASARGIPFWQIMSACATANLPIGAVYAYFGANLLGDVPVLYLLAAVVLLTAIGLVIRRKRGPPPPALLPPRRGPTGAG